MDVALALHIAGAPRPCVELRAEAKDYRSRVPRKEVTKFHNDLQRLADGAPLCQVLGLLMSNGTFVDGEVQGPNLSLGATPTPYLVLHATRTNELVLAIVVFVVPYLRVALADAHLAICPRAPEILAEMLQSQQERLGQLRIEVRAKTTELENLEKQVRRWQTVAPAKRRRRQIQSGLWPGAQRQETAPPPHSRAA
jgi:hypothetical protein